MAITHNLGFPRIGSQRELKFALEDYWQERSDETALIEVGQQLRKKHWDLQSNSGLKWVPVGDFSYYDQVLDTSILLGAIPDRFRHNQSESELAEYFRIARGRAPGCCSSHAGEMTKWFDSNYHYIVPELNRQTSFSLHADKLLNEIAEAKAQGLNYKPVILGPLSFLWLSKVTDDTDKLALLAQLIPVYGRLISQLADIGVDWLQIDEPILGLDLPQSWRTAFEQTYHQLQTRRLKVLIAIYFGPLKENLGVATQLPVDGLHIDAVRGGDEVNMIIDKLSPYKVLSLGVIDGRNIWRNDLSKTLDWLEPIHQKLGERLWLAPSCSLLHVPVDLAEEAELDSEIRSWLAFAVQKLEELSVLAMALELGRESVRALLVVSDQALASRKSSVRVNNENVKNRVASIDDSLLSRKSNYQNRQRVQASCLNLPLFPTTTIGSFPQTAEIRKLRLAHRKGNISSAQYDSFLKEEIKTAVALQESIGIDVLVHGEAERNDMVEYFGEQLAGYCFTRYGWVQSYGSRCVKPPIIYGDVQRRQPMTVQWSEYAQSLTGKPMKGMLSGPITMLQWSFVRDDQSRETTAKQIGLALRDEVNDLETAGIGIIQVDEPALREGLPLRRADWPAYLAWSIDAFRLSTSGVSDEIQIHTHMCYAEFNDIIEAIGKLDADVITIETSRSQMELLDAFVDYRYPNDIGPGVYDIHSPNIPTVNQMTELMNKALQYLPKERLWVNPDCGLKTRQWDEVKLALVNMVQAASVLREQAELV